MATTTSTTTSNLVDKKWKTLTFVASGVAVVALALMVYFIWDNSKKSKVIKTQVESIKEYKATNLRLASKNTMLLTSKEELEASLSVANENITAKQIVITRLNQENKTLYTIKTQIGEMEKATKDINVSNSQLQSIQQKMRKTIATREKQNKDFEAQIK